MGIEGPSQRGSFEGHDRDLRAAKGRHNSEELPREKQALLGGRAKSGAEKIERGLGDEFRA
jgi:hypothetical protein